MLVATLIVSGVFKINFAGEVLPFLLGIY